MKAKIILACINYLLCASDERTAAVNAAVIRQKFIFDDAREKKMEEAKSSYEQKLAEEAAKEEKAKQEAEIKMRETEL